jgi:hypothetical protein
MCLSAYVCTCVHVCEHMCVYVCVYVRVHMCACVYVCIYVRARAGLRQKDRQGQYESTAALGGRPYLLNLLYLLIEAADHVVRRVGHFFDQHEAHQRVNLVRKDLR